MTRNEAKAFINSLVKLRVSATDEQAVEAQSIYPVWREDVTYVINDRVLYNEVLYKVITAHTSQPDWTPDVAHSLFTKVLIPNENAVPEWEQPDSTNPYMIGDKVSHNSKIWISVVDGNVWEPSVYGWEEV